MTSTSSLRGPDNGFSLAELLIAVVILGILSSIAAVTYGRYVGKARTSEAAAVLAEMASKEQTYFMEFGHYLPLRADNVVTRPSATETNVAFYPADPNGTTFNSKNSSTSITNPALWPNGWRSVGLRTRSRSLYCTYMTNAGDLGQAVPVGGIGAGLIGAAAATTPWFYSLAACNLLGPSGFPAQVTVMALGSTLTNLSVFNDGR